MDAVRAKHDALNPAQSKRAACSKAIEELQVDESSDDRCVHAALFAVTKHKGLQNEVLEVGQ